MTARVWPVDAVTGAPSYTGRALRQTSISPFVAQATGTRPLGGLSGVRPGTPITIASATSTTWTVTPFLGLIDGEATAIAGVYAYSFDGNVTGSVTAAAGSARIDRLDVQVSDPAESDGSSVPSVAIIYTAGTPGAGVPASAPARSHALALINVPASGGGSPTVTWNASYYCAPGGFLPFNTLAGLNLFTTAAPFQHATVINDSTTTNNGDYVYVGSTWIYTGTNTATITTFGTGWTAGTGAQVPKVQMNGNRVDLTGSVLFGTTGSYSSILTVPAGFQPPTTAARFVGNAILSAGGVAVELQLTAGVLNAPASGYNIGSLPFSNRLPLHFFWYMD